MKDYVKATAELDCVLHLNGLCFEDEFGHQRWDISLIEHDVRDALQQRLHWCHTVQDETPAQETVVKQQKHHPWTHLKHTQMFDNCKLYVHICTEICTDTLFYLLCTVCGLIHYLHLHRLKVVTKIIQYILSF